MSDRYSPSGAVTRSQKRILANLLLLHGYDNLLEFYGEIVEDAPAPSAYPTYEQARPVLTG